MRLDPLGAGTRPTAENRFHAARLRDCVRALLGVGPDITVLVQELRCTEEGCPPFETVVAVLEPAAPDQRTVWKIDKPRAEVSPEELRTLITSYPEGHQHEHK